MEIPEGEEKGKGTKSLFKAVMAKIFQTWGDKQTSKFMRPKDPK